MTDLRPLLDRVLDRGADQPLRAGLGDRLDADAGVGADVPAELLLQQLDELLRLGRALLDLEAGVDVLGVLAEDHHVDLLGVLHRRRHALEPAHRAQAHVEVEDLAQRDVERADAAADRRGERALDPDQVLAERVDGLVGQPVAGRVERLLARRAPLSTRSSCRASAAAASITSCAAGQMSTPVPSPSMNGMMGSSGTDERAVGVIVIFSAMSADVSRYVGRARDARARRRTRRLRRGRRRRGGGGRARCRRSRRRRAAAASRGLLGRRDADAEQHGLVGHRLAAAGPSRSRVTRRARRARRSRRAATRRRRSRCDRSQIAREPVVGRGRRREQHRLDAGGVGGVAPAVELVEREVGNDRAVDARRRASACAHRSWPECARRGCSTSSRRAGRATSMRGHARRSRRPASRRGRARAGSPPGSCGRP